MQNQYLSWLPIMTGLLALGGVWLGSRLNSHATKAAKLFEMRVASYSAILGLFADAEAELRHLGRLVDGGLHESAAPVVERFDAAAAKLWRRVTEDTIIFSDSAARSITWVKLEFEHTGEPISTAIASMLAQLENLKQEFAGAARTEISRQVSRRVWG